MAALTDTLGGRKVQYNGITLPYTTLDIQCEPVIESTRHVYSVWVFTFVGTETRDDQSSINSASRYVLNEARRRLMQPRQTLSIDERNNSGAFENIFTILPGFSENQSKAILSATNSREVVDIQGGPQPIFFRPFQLFGTSYRYIWRLKIVTFGGDGSEIADTFEAQNGGPFVAGMSAYATYGYDRDHYLTRRVVGIIHLPFRESLAPTGGGRDGYATDLTLRTLLTAGSTSSNKLFRHLFSIPGGMQRLQQEFSWDESLSNYSFQLTDREFYRAPPQDITTAEVDYSVNYDGVTYSQPAVTTLEGFMAAPKSTPRELIMQRILELSNILMGQDATFGQFVNKFEYRIPLYGNRIEFQITGLINFGMLVTSDNTDKILTVLGLGGALGDALDTLSDSNTALAPPVMGTAGVGGPAYDSSFGGASSLRQLTTSGNKFPAYSPDGSLFFHQSDYAGVVDLRTVEAKPNSIRFVVAKDLAFVFPRDETNATKPTPGVVIRGRTFGMAFFGCVSQLRQRPATSAGFILPLIPSDVAATLNTQGSFSVEDSHTVEVFKGVPILTPVTESVYRTTYIWRLYVSPTRQRAILTKYGSNLELIERAISQRLEEIRDIRAFSVWLTTL